MTRKVVDSLRIRGTDLPRDLYNRLEGKDYGFYVDSRGAIHKGTYAPKGIVEVMVQRNLVGGDGLPQEEGVIALCRNFHTNDIYMAGELPFKRGPVFDVIQHNMYVDRLLERRKAA